MHVDKYSSHIHIVIHADLMHYGEVIMSAMASQNNQPHYCLLNRLFRRRAKNIKAPRHRPLWGNSLLTSEFPEQRPTTLKNFQLIHHCLNHSACGIRQYWKSTLESYVYVHGICKAVYGYPHGKVIKRWKNGGRAQMMIHLWPPFTNMV